MNQSSTFIFGHSENIRLIVSFHMTNTYLTFTAVFYDRLFINRS